ncbi:MAG: HNH endonuclease [Desulfobulbaceae bacterium]|nr:HNH endonuclease [Desulfobulbaceae bacterium]
MDEKSFWDLRDCFVQPIPQVFQAAILLSEAADAILVGNLDQAERLILEADMPVLNDYVRSIASTVSVNIHRVRKVPDAPPINADRIKKRMPSKSVEYSVYTRDGWHCRFCGTCVVAKSARKEMNRLLPTAARWGLKNIEKHAGLSALEATLDHILPHSRGGDNSLENLVTACGPCQFGRGGWTLAEVGFRNPFLRLPIIDGWDGLLRLVK